MQIKVWTRKINCGIAYTPPHAKHPVFSYLVRTGDAEWKVPAHLVHRGSQSSIVIADDPNSTDTAETCLWTEICVAATGPAAADCESTPTAGRGR